MPLDLYMRHRLRALRQAASLTQGQISSELGIDRSTYTYYESGRSQPSYEILGRICDIYRIPVSVLLDPCSEKPFFIDAGEDTTLVDPNFITMLAKDEQSLVIHFRRLTFEQRRQALENFGVIHPTGDALSRMNERKKKKGTKNKDKE